MGTAPRFKEVFAKVFVHALVKVLVKGFVNMLVFVKCSQSILLIYKSIFELMKKRINTDIYTYIYIYM